MSLLHRFGRLFRTHQLDQDLNDELRSHLEMRAQDSQDAGMTPEEARLDAVRRFGNTTLIQEQSRQARILGSLETAGQDLRYSFRLLRKSPGFTLIAVIVLALGIGANTAIFSVVSAVLLHPLPYKDADRLVVVMHRRSDPVNTANYFDWRDQSKSFSAMGGADYWSPNLTSVGNDPPEHIVALKVTQNLFPALDVQPMLGRLFFPEEEQTGSEHVVILSHRLWLRRFAGDTNIIGHKISLNGEEYTIVGVMPPSFRFAPFWGTRAEMWVPNVLVNPVRSGNHLRVFARLKPGVTLEQARSEMATISARLEQEYPGTNREVTVTPLDEMVVGDVRPVLLMLMGAAGFVLLIACANVTHMMLARSAARRKEVAVRAALGARRWRTIRLFLTESLMLTSTGTIAGLLLAKWGTTALVSLMPSKIFGIELVGVGPQVIFFIAGISLLTGVALGLAPAFRTSDDSLTDSLKDGGRGSNDGIRRNRFRSFLVASEFALALMLLVGAGLMIRSFMALQSIDAGFNPHGVVSMMVSVAGSREASPDLRPVFYRELLDKIRALPGVQSAGAINHLPLAGDLWGWPFQIEGRPKPRPGESPNAVYRVVSPGYFQTMQLPLLRGRDISAADTLTAPGVVIINERLARRYWPGEDPLGKRIALPEDDGKDPVWLSIIGIAHDARQGEWSASVYSEIYLPLQQSRSYLEDRAAHYAYITLVARTTADPASLVPAIREAVWSFDRNVPISDVVTMDEVVATANAQPRFQLLLLAIFAGVALVLAAAGIYGVMSYSVTRRTHEIGVRLALGASRGGVIRLITGQGMTLAIIGAAAGIAGALVLGRLVTKLMYGVKPTDPLTFAAVVATLGIVALAATYVPARRASRVDPVEALRHE